jgi:uncharacterized membrane protein
LIQSHGSVGSESVRFSLVLSRLFKEPRFNHLVCSVVSVMDLVFFLRFFGGETEMRQHSNNQNNHQMAFNERRLTHTLTTTSMMIERTRSNRVIQTDTILFNENGHSCPIKKKTSTLCMLIVFVQITIQSADCSGA